MFSSIKLPSFLCLALLGAAISLPNAVAADKPGKVVKLTDGKTFNGWDGATGTIWKIREGAFVGGGLESKVAQNEFLASKQSFTNFVLKLRFKLVGTEGFVNGGVQVRSERTKTPPNEMAGYQVDIGDPEWWGCIYDESRRNKIMAKSDMTAINKVLKRGDWNDYLIRCEGRRVRAYINGVQTVDYMEADESIVQHGRIGLQVHGGGKAEAWYKDIEVEVLP